MICSMGSIDVLASFFSVELLIDANTTSVAFLWGGKSNDN